MLTFRDEFNLARPGRRNLHSLSSGVGPFPLQDNAATIFTIANTGAMLMFGQERSREYAALTAEPDCTQILPRSRYRRLAIALIDFQARTTTAKRWQTLMWYDSVQPFR